MAWSSSSFQAKIAGVHPLCRRLEVHCPVRLLPRRTACKQPGQNGTQRKTESFNNFSMPEFARTTPQFAIIFLCPISNLLIRVGGFEKKKKKLLNFFFFYKPPHFAESPTIFRCFSSTRFIHRDSVPRLAPLLKKKKKKFIIK